VVPNEQRMPLALYVAVVPVLAVISGLIFWAMVILCNRRLPDQEKLRILHLPPWSDNEGEKKIQRALPYRQVGFSIRSFLRRYRGRLSRGRVENLAVLGRCPWH